MSKKNGDGEDGNGTGGDDYEIGYRKPPKHTRWKKGQSGNKRGRPKKKLGISDFERAFDEALGDLLAVNDNGTVRKIKKLKALAIQTVNKAVKGHHPSANLVMAHYARRAAGAPEEPGSSPTAEEFEAEMEADCARSPPGRSLPGCPIAKPRMRTTARTTQGRRTIRRRTRSTDRRIRPFTINQRPDDLRRGAHSLNRHDKAAIARRNARNLLYTRTAAGLLCALQHAR